MTGELKGQSLDELIQVVREGIYTVGMQHIEDDATEALNEIVRRVGAGLWMDLHCPKCDASEQHKDGEHIRIPCPSCGHGEREVLVFHEE